MSERYDFQVPGFLSSLWLAYRGKYDDRSVRGPWIVDKATGHKYAVDEADSAALDALSEAMDRMVPDLWRWPKRSKMELIDGLFDRVATAIVQKHRGDGSEFDDLSAWVQADWDKWVGIESVEARARKNNRSV